MRLLAASLRLDVRRPPAASLLLLCFFALLATACLTPPALRGSATNGEPGTTAAPADHPREFTHTSSELLAKLRLGWNLGNSLEVPDGETAWGNPMPTPDLFRAVAKAGFGLVRIPITWTPHMGPAPAYTVDSGWLEHVDEVLGYCRSAGLYCIINVHHDGADGFKAVQWLSLKDAEGKTTEDNNAVVRSRFVAVWSQIAKHFANYGEELLFESMNEVHDGYGKPDPRHYAIINDLDQQFVNVVRASGGNNGKRHLIVPGYNTNIDATIEGFKLPADPVPNRLILSVHYYDPYLFALVGKTQTWGRASPGRDDWGQEDFVVAQFDKLKSNFIDRGIPVLLGEYGATYQAGFEEYRRYYVEYVTKAAVDRGMLPVYWDNGGSGSGGEKFGIMDRRTNGVLHPDLMEALRRAATSSYALADVAPPTPSK
ncbi:MAG TPA: glycoside hydrolase family 5 protein [Polyangiaceae bacterium]|nr:glycoside hydrolase family 5 protein [Polyangiaceae bacterium]